MGLLGSSKKTYVSSVVYNMAGDVKDRADYLKTLTSGYVLNNGKKTYTREMLDNYLGGPGISLRHFGRWAETSGYNAALGLTQSTLETIARIDTTLVAGELRRMYGKNVYVNEAEIGLADFGQWANQYVLKNYPKRYLEEWTADYNETTGMVTVRFPVTGSVQFMPEGYVPGGQYLYVSLNQERSVASESSFTAWLEGTPTSTNEYTLATSSTETVSVPLKHKVTVVQKTMGEPENRKVFDNPSSESVKLKKEIYTKWEPLPDPVEKLVVGEVTKSIEIQEAYDLQDVKDSDVLIDTSPAGKPRTTTTTTERQEVRKFTRFRTGTVTSRVKAWEPEEIYIYRRNSGNPTLDSLFVSETTAGKFFPAIPIRIDNKFVSETDYPDLLPWVKKAVRRSTQVSFDQLVDLIAENKSLNEIDFAYVVFGASLNTPENSAKRYLFEFFSNIAGTSDPTALANYWSQYDAAVASWDAWTLWYTGNRFEDGPNGTVAIAEPERLPFPVLPTQRLTVKSNYNYDIQIQYSGIVESLHAGRMTSTAKLHDVRIYKGSATGRFTYPEQTTAAEPEKQFMRWSAPAVEQIVLEWQHTNSSFRRLVVTGLVHTNNVYGGKSVTITAWEALDDLDESGFIVPMQQDILMRMPIPLATQFCTASTYMMFNCYQVVKKKWYQTGLFRVVLVIVIIVVSIFFPPAGGVAGGILGANAAVGIGLGFTGTAAIVAGAIANAIAAMVVMQVLSRVAVGIFGEKLGSVIGAIATLVAMTVGPSMVGGASFSTSFANMMSAENLMKLMSSLSDGISNYIRASAMELVQESQDVLAAYEREAKAINERFMEEFGNGGIINPLQFSGILDFKLEDPAVFLNRTLMTGTDIVELSHSMLDNFVSLTTSLKLE